MQNQITKREDALSQSQDSANGIDKPSYLIEREEIQNTPFMLVKQNGNYFAVLGQYRITPEFEYKHEVTDYLITEQWNVVLDMITSVIDHINKIQNQKTNTTL